MEQKLEKKFWLSLVIFGLMGQVAWVVENMYLNVFIYKMFAASASDISLMVGASAAAATITTIFMGALSDHIGKRKLLICGGYILWGISILGFAFIRMDLLSPFAESTVACAALAVNLVIALDCIMTFLGSTANDAAFNAWMTDWGDENNRGKIEGINAMMPMLAIIVVFGGFMAFNLDESGSWVSIFTIIGVGVILIGLLGVFLIKEAPNVVSTKKECGYWETVLYSFKPSVVKENKLLYAVIGAFAVFGISINVFMPYLILYYEKSLGMTNYVLVMAPAIIIAAVITAFYGKLFDMLGFKGSVIPTVLLLMLGYVLLYLGKAFGVVFVGSLLMMTGYLTGMAIFGAMIRNHIPENKAGQFQGIRIIGQVLIPGIIGPAIGAWVLRDAVEIVNSDGTTSFLPDERIFLAALIVAVVLYLVLVAIFTMMRKGHYDLYTKAGEEVLAGKDTWNSHPRPQLKRESYHILKEGWTLNGKEIKMPFPPQALLSGYKEKVGDYLFYSIHFEVEAEEGKRILLHFGAVDQIATVILNGDVLGTNEGGYLPFTYDITNLLLEEEENCLQVFVKDTLSHVYPYGKQTKKRGGMWYTPVSGIWQNVWLEEVPYGYVEKVKITPDMENVKFEITTNVDIEGPRKLVINLQNGEEFASEFEGNIANISLKGHNPRLWSMEDPYLYEAKLYVGEDVVEIYFALREIAIRNINGVNRVCLNGKPIFMNGVLDQGYYPDGIFLPAEEEEYERDILRMKELGFNMLRKHIKVEPECFYYYCDKHGMLVLQDMINNGCYSFIRDTALPTIGMLKKDDTKTLVSKKTKEVFENYMIATQNHLYNHPCIVAYTIFNEGWGQFESDRMYGLAKANDPTRLYDATSGWFAQKESDFDSDHIYFGDKKPCPKERPYILSEFGGSSYAVDGHFYSKYNTYGYGSCQNSEELSEAIAKRYEELLYPVLAKGACACVYTQVSDVEDEVNGLYTYDRKVCKVNPEVMRKVSRKLIVE